MKKSHVLIYVLFAITAFVVLLNRYTAFYINDYRLHFFFLFVAAASFVIIVGHLFQKLRSGKSIILTFLIVGLLCFLKAYFSWGADWKTQTILYSNNAHSSKSIDYQMAPNRFSFGYKKRVVEVHHLAPGMDWVTDSDTTTVDVLSWTKANHAVNALNLPAAP